MSAFLPAGRAAAADVPAAGARAIRRVILAVLVLGVLAILWAAGQRVFAERLRPATPAMAALDIAPAEKQVLLEVTRGPLATSRVEGPRAEEINGSLPFARAPIEAASPFQLTAALAAEDRARAQLCLAQAVYYEAGFEPAAGRRAVAQVILNRLRHPAFPKSVCGVVYEGSSAPGCQFSFTCDGSLRRAPAAAAWAAASEIAREALAGKVDRSVGQATHYHADYVAPYWAPRLAKLVQVGTHIFYRWPGAWGLRRAFTGRYAGREAVVGGRAPDEADAVELAGIPQMAPDERRAPNDVGGRLDVSKGWTLAIPDPTATRGTLSRVLATQSKVELAAAKESPGTPGKAGMQ